MREPILPKRAIQAMIDFACINAIVDDGSDIALLQNGAAAGGADFQLTQFGEGDWRLRALSKRGTAWLKANALLQKGDSVPLSLAAANSFLSQSRANGLRTRYVGHIGRSII